MLKRHRLVLLAVVAAALVVPSCTCGKKKPHKKPDAGAKKLPRKSVAHKSAAGLAFRLSPGGNLEKRVERARYDKGKKLPPAEVKALLARLDPLKPKAGDKKAFAFRARSLKPPRTGKRVTGAFPPPARPPKPATAKAGALRVLRFRPKGEVTIARNISVTFSQPMVPVTSHDDAVKGGVPVKIKPTVKGIYRWIGTKTLLFEPKGRVPMATRFDIEVPLGTRSTVGGALAKAKRWHFSTPAPRMVASMPRGSGQRVDPLLFVGFDQRIDPKAVLEKITLTAKGGKTVSLRAATEAEIAKRTQMKQIADAAKKAKNGRRYVILKATRALEPDTRYTVTVGAGTPSAEGPLKTKKPQKFTFRTFAPLKVRWRNCKSKAYRCQPMQTFSIGFNNRLDPEAFDKWKKRVLVRPEVAGGLSLRISGSYLYISGRTKGRTVYTVSLPDAIRDQYGQTLGSNNILRFHVGSARPWLSGTGGHFRVLDPHGDKSVTITSINHKRLDVKLYSVTPAQWNAYRKFARRGLRKKVPATPPGKLRWSKIISVKAPADELAKTRIELAPALDGGYGQVVVVVKQVPFPAKQWTRQYYVSWVQATDLAVDGFVDHEGVLAWATRLRDGKPVEGATISFASGAGKPTDKGGLARLAFSAAAAGKRAEPGVLVVRKGKDVAMLPERSYLWSSYSSWHPRPPPGEHLRWYVFDDRKLYKPKEKVNVKGWLRLVDMGKTARVRFAAGAKTISYEVKGPRGNKVAAGTAQVGALGGFNFEFKLPDNVNLGSARVKMTAAGVDPKVRSGTVKWHYFRIQEFRRPEYSVSAKADPGPHLIGGAGEASVTAKYYSGGALPNAEVQWHVYASAGYFTPPNRQAYSFVGWRPSWFSYRRRRVRSKSASFKGYTDSRGVHKLRVDFDSADPPRPYVLRASAAVKDVNRQTWRSSTRLLVHPASVYVGLKSKRYFVKRGSPLELDVIVSDLEGKLVAGRPVTLRAERMTYVYDNKKQRWRYKQVDPQTCEHTSQAAPSKCSFKTAKGGTYLITALVTDKKGRKSRTVITRWVAGGKAKPSRRVKLQSVRLIADKKKYAPGDTAEVLVNAPFPDGEGLVTLRRAGILEKRRLRFEGSSATIKIPIKDDHMPSLYVQVDVVGAAKRVDNNGKVAEKLPKRPAFAVGSISLSVPPLTRKLAIVVKPAKSKLGPGETTEISVVVKDAAGRPQPRAQVALFAVDESVLALTGYKLSNPVYTFYPYRSAGVRNHRMRRYVRLADPTKLRNLLKQRAINNNKDKLGGLSLGRGAPGAPTTGAAPPPAPKATSALAKKKPSARRARRSKLAEKKPAEDEAKTGKKAGGDSAAKAAKIKVRKDFRALALFAPALVTDDKGATRMKFKLPDSLTRYRVMAVAVVGEKLYGLGESQITARLPLAIRPSPPRFLNYGDRFELPIVVQNQTDTARKVKIALRTVNAKLLQGAGRVVSVPPNDRLEVRFPAAAVEAGTARFQIAVSSGKFADAAQVKLPVWTPATTEAFATYGTIDKGAAVQPIKMPSNVVTAFGGLEITTSSTALHALTDALLYLVSYRFECSEQLASRILAVAALRDVLTAFKAPGLPSAAAMQAAVTRDLKRLAGMQNYNGGFPMWIRGYPAWPFNSIHVAHALVRAKAKKFKVPPAMLTRALRYLRRIRSHIPSYYAASTRRAIRAYALYVRALAGDKDVAKAQALYGELTRKKHKPELEGIAWIYSVLAKQPAAAATLGKLRRLLQNRVTETAGAAHFVSSYSDGAHLVMHSDRRLDGLLLEGLILDQPKSGLIAKIVRGLLAHRKRGRWSNTQENAWVLLALDRYFNTYEKITPNFVARAWLGERFAGQQAFRGRSTKRFAIEIPMKVVAKVGAADLTLQKAGAGRLYYRIGMRYAPANLKPPPASHGFTVRRRYEAVDSKDDVKRDKDGTWRVKAGARVRVVVTMVAPTRRYHVALVDPLPAGLEPLNAGLRGTDSAPTPSFSTPRRSLRYLGRRGRGRWGHRWRWRSHWYEHHNLRDERAEAFTSLLWGGVHTFTYVTRATTPGTFVVPPPKAEEMYHPETFGRGPGDKLIVE